MISQILKKSCDWIQNISATPDRFHQVEEDFKAGKVSAKNLSNKQKAVFLDRDGTVNKYVGFLRNINDFEFNHVVFIIRKDIEKEFKEVIGDRILTM